ncbi:MAG TPA: site-2 protease family protein, partial [bacterium]|nr:site-2 protease family protein [bacterium]
SFIEAVQHGFITAVGATYFIVRSIKQMVSGEVNAKDALGGPLMIAKTTGDMKRQYGWEGIWNLMALLSLSLAVFNLLPVPALDGGHLFMLAIEGVMRRPLSLKVKLRAQQAGMAILLSLIVYIFFNDIVKLTGIF